MEEYSEKIQDYIEGQLVGNDLVQFEAQLAVDAELRNLLALQKEVYEILAKRIVSPEMELRDTFSAAENSLRYGSTSIQQAKIKRFIPYIAAACILFIASLFFFNSANTLYDLPLMRSEVVRGQAHDMVYEDAVKAVNAGNYPDARLKLESLLAMTPSNEQYTYYIGLTYVGQEDWQQAKQVLNPLAKGESVFAEEASYYLAISYYRTGNKEDAVRLLKQIPMDSTLGKRAEKLVDKIN